MIFKAFIALVLLFSVTCGYTLLLLSSPAFGSDSNHDHSSHSMADHSEHMKMAMAEPTANVHDILVDFELQAASGAAVTIKDYRDKYLLLGFGFTHCEFVCPTMVANMASVIRSANTPLTGIFISVDTERDTPLITHGYTQRFHKSIDGLSGSYDQVSKAAENFKVSFAITKTAQNYTVQHGASIFLIDPDGLLVEVFALNATTEEVVASINSNRESG